MLRAVITDSNWGDVTLEREALTSAGFVLEAGQARNDDELIELTREADVVITQFARVTAAVIARMERARAIIRYGIGVDNVDVIAARERSIPVCNVPDYCIDEVADHTLGLILDATRCITEISAATTPAGWTLRVPLRRLRTLRDLTVGIVGFGRIGREVVARLRSFKATILVHDPVVPVDEIRASGATPVTFETLLATADLLSLHCPSTPSTRKMINETSLTRCKPGLLVVNAGRGDLIDLQALAAGLQSGVVGAAALDVCDVEPLPDHHPIRQCPRLVLTPHIAACSERSIRTLRSRVVEHAIRALRDEPMHHVVNGVVREQPSFLRSKGRHAP